TMGAGNDFLARGILAASPKDETIPVNMATGRAYDNIKAISRQSGVYFVDRETNMPLPIQGLYGLELFNHYKAEPVLSFENEDWHHKDLELGTYTSVLYELKLR
ncbi:MAG: hypothetical protein KKD39_02455, partial [Candidatus Altiarchaeota archaeon]|nr:hypothetical protein [Candidatus Altiarchaeota archaeon]